MNAFDNLLIIKKILHYVPRKLDLVLINKSFCNYICNNVEVEFDMCKFIIWLMISKKYKPLDIYMSFLVTNYIPSSILRDPKNILKFLRIEMYKRLRVVIILNSFRTTPIVELYRSLFDYILHDYKNMISLCFPYIYSLSIIDKSAAINKKLINLDLSKLTTLKQIRIDGEIKLSITLPDNIELLSLKCNLLDINIIQNKHNIKYLNLNLFYSIYQSMTQNKIDIIKNKIIEILINKIEVLGVERNTFQYCFDNLNLIHHNNLKLIYLDTESKSKIINNNNNVLFEEYKFPLYPFSVTYYGSNHDIIYLIR
tara:strand:+ start:4682 stop:5614 length:933 start_codon:yes stop_codon:yes gene_type:complete